VTHLGSVDLSIDAARRFRKRIAAGRFDLAFAASGLIGLGAPLIVRTWRGYGDTRYTGRLDVHGSIQLRASMTRTRMADRFEICSGGHRPRVVVTVDAAITPYDREAALLHPRRTAPGISRPHGPISHCFIPPILIIGHVARDSFPACMCSPMWLIIPSCILIILSRIIFRCATISVTTAAVASPLA
jgi:hypothetical protein